MVELCGSLLAANHAYLARDLKTAENNGIKRFHIDVCDGHYTPHVIFGDQLVRNLREETPAVLEIHIAVRNMLAVTDPFLQSGADIITIQHECCELPSRLMKQIRNSGINPGICFVPATRFEEMEFYLDEVEYVNILGVDPGIGGQKFISKVLNKIEKTANFISNNGLSARISVDGGVNLQTMKSIINAGSNILTLGSAMFSGRIEENIEKIRRQIG